MPSRPCLDCGQGAEARTIPRRPTRMIGRKARDLGLTWSGSPFVDEPGVGMGEYQSPIPVRRRHSILLNSGHMPDACEAVFSRVALARQMSPSIRRRPIYSPSFASKSGVKPDFHTDPRPASLSRTGSFVKVSPSLRGVTASPFFRPSHGHGQGTTDTCPSIYSLHLLGVLSRSG